MFLFPIITTYIHIPPSTNRLLWSPSKTLLIPISLDSTQLAVCGVDITALWPHGIDSFEVSVGLRESINLRFPTRKRSSDHIFEEKKMVSVTRNLVIVTMRLLNGSHEISLKSLKF